MPEFLGTELEGPFDRGPVRLPPSWVALVEIIHRLEQEPYRWPVGRTMFQKIAYFATEDGLPTNLEYSRGSFGPFASGLKRLQASLMANGLLTEEKRERGNTYVIRPGREYEKGVAAYRGELDEWGPIIDRVADLFMRFDTTQAEIAATVHFAANRLVPERREGRATEMEVLDAVRSWKMRRKPPLRDEGVARMIRNLNVLGWVDLEPSDDLPLPEHLLVDEFDVVEA
jgi:uncharacterized protein YwgA